MKAAGITLRPATLDDLALLQHWDRQPHVRSGVPEGAWDWAEELRPGADWRQLFIAETDGVPIAFVQVMDPAGDESRYWGDFPGNVRAVDIWIGEAAYLNQGFGTATMDQVLESCFRDPAVEAVLVDPLASNTRAHRFYERLGFRFVQRRHFGPDDCCVYRLDRADST